MYVTYADKLNFLVWLFLWAKLSWDKLKSNQEKSVFCNLKWICINWHFCYEKRRHQRSQPEYLPTATRVSFAHCINNKIHSNNSYLYKPIFCEWKKKDKFFSSEKAHHSIDAKQYFAYPMQKGKYEIRTDRTYVVYLKRLSDADGDKGFCPQSVDRERKAASDITHRSVRFEYTHFAS